MSDKQYIDQTFRRSVYLERLKQSMVNEFGLTIKQIDKVISKLDVDELTPKQLDKYLADIGKVLESKLTEHSEKYKSQLVDIFGDCVDFEKESLINAYNIPAQSIAVPADITAAAATAIAKPLPIVNAESVLIKDMLADFEKKETKRVLSAIRAGHFEGKTNQQLIQQIRGTRAKKYKDGILDISTRHAEAIVRTGVQQVANDARLEIAKQNSDIVIGEQIIATLDSHTCLVAGTLIDTPTGKRPIEQIQKGELVYGGSGKVREVSATLKSYKDKLCKVTLSNGETIVCTQDHRWWNGKEWIEAKDLKIGEFLPKTL